MPSNIVTYTHFEGGKNEQSPPIIIEQQPDTAMLYCADSQNFYTHPSGLLKLPGASSVITSPSAGSVMGEFEYEKSDGTLINLVCKNGKVFTVAGSTETQVYTGGTAGYPYQGCQYNGVFILCNGKDTPLKYDGSTCVAITFTDPQTIWNSAKPQGCRVFRNRLFYWGDPTYPHRIYTPVPGTYNNFDNSNHTVDSFDVEVGGGGPITGFEPLTDDMAIIYKRHCIKRLSGSNPFGSGIDEFSITEVSRAVGCIAPKSIVTMDGDHFFLSKGGFRQLSAVISYGDLEYGQPSFNLQKTVNTFNWTPSVIQNACAVYDEGYSRIYLAVPTGSNSFNDSVFTYDIQTKALQPVLWITQTSSLAYFNRQIYIGDNTGQIYLFNSGNSWAGTAINGWWKSFYIAHGGFSYKRYKSLNIYVDGSGKTDYVLNWNILQRGVPVASQTSEAISADPGWDFQNWDTTNWSSGTPGLTKVTGLGRGTAIQIMVTNSSTTEQPNIRAIELEYEIFGRAQG